MFSKKATKIDKIFKVDFKFSKSHLLELLQ